MFHLTKLPIGVVFAGIGLVLFFAVPMLLWFSSPPLCGNEIYARVPSPSGKLVAVGFTRGCGAATSDYTQVAILEAGEELKNEAGDVFSSEAASLNLEWLSDHELVITYRKSVTDAYKVEEYRGVTIRYKTIPE